MKCMSWPNTTYGCTDNGDDWALLDAATFETSECKSLCLQHASSDGCCFVGDAYGCYWKGGAIAGSNPNSNEKDFAITCTTYGESWEEFVPSKIDLLDSNIILLDNQTHAIFFNL